MAATFDVGLIVTSRRLSLMELATRLGRKPQTGSHDKGEPRGLKRSGLVWTCTVWRENVRDADASVYQQCSQLLRDMPPACAELLAAEPDDISVTLHVAVFYESAYCNFVAPRS